MTRGKVKPSSGWIEQNKAVELDDRSRSARKDDLPPRCSYIDEHGKPLKCNPNFNGPLAKRSCNDVMCCILLLVFIFGWGVVGLVAFKWGNPRMIVNPTDSEKRICGQETSTYNMIDRKYLLFFDMTKCFELPSTSFGCPTPQVCVKECPTMYYRHGDLAVGNSDGSTYDYRNMSAFCKRNVQNEELTISSAGELKNYVDLDLCPSYTIPMKPVLGRCMPKKSASIFKNLGDCALTGDNFTNTTIPNRHEIMSKSKAVEDHIEFGVKIFDALRRGWWLVLIGLCLAMPLAFLWIFLMRRVAGVMVWLSIFVPLVMACWGSMFFWCRWYRNDVERSSYVKTWLVLAIICSIISVIIFVVFVFLRTRIQAAIALIEESSKALTHMPSVLLFPIFPSILFLIAIVGWAVMSSAIQSMVGDPLCHYLQQNANISLPNNATNGDSCDCDLVTMNASCYFSRYDRKKYTVILQFYNLFGFVWITFFISGLADLTMAGAFASYYWAYRKPEDIPVSPVLSSLKTTLRTKDAASLIKRNAVQVWVLDKAAVILLFIGESIIVAGGVSFFLFDYDPNCDMDLNYYFIPVIITITGSFMISRAFFGIYKMAIDTTLLCFLEDRKLKRGSPEKP